MSLATWLFFLYAQQVSGITMPIFRRLRLCCWLTTLVVLFLVCCVLEVRCGWARVVSGLQLTAQSFWKPHTPKQCLDDVLILIIQIQNFFLKAPKSFQTHIKFLQTEMYLTVLGYMIWYKIIHALQEVWFCRLNVSLNRAKNNNVKGQNRYSNNNQK